MNLSLILALVLLSKLSLHHRKQIVQDLQDCTGLSELILYNPCHSVLNLLFRVVCFFLSPCLHTTFSNSTFLLNAHFAVTRSRSFRSEGISDEVMGQIAREMNLSETVFVLKPESDEVLRRLRIFTPTREIPFAGHPIVGTWTALAQEGVVPIPEGGNGWQRIFHEVGIGVLPVDIEFKDGRPVQVVMTQGSFRSSMRLKTP